jgi:hypothetical protein
MSKTPMERTENISRMLRDGITETFIKVKAATLPAEKEAQRRHVEGLMDDWEITLGKRVAQMFEPIFAHDGDIGPLNVLREICNKPTNQVDFLVELVGAVIGSLGVSSDIGRIVFAPTIQDIQAKNLFSFLDPVSIATLMNQGLMTIDAGNEEVAKSGYDSAHLLQIQDLQLTYPSVLQGEEWYRRNIIDEGLLAEIKLRNQMNSDFGAAYDAAAYDTMSPADAIEAYIKGQLDQPTAEAYFVQGGGILDQFNVLSLTAGNPIGVEQALNLWNHSLITEADVTNVILHSRINPQFEAMAKLLRYKFLSPYQIVSALKAGDCTADQATSWLLAQGYPQDQVSAVVGGASVPAAKAAKALSETLILDTYEAGLLNQAQATELLESVGWPATAVPVVLESYDARKILSAATTVITLIKKQFLAKEITEAQASTDLDSVGVDASVRDAYLRDWAVAAQLEQKTLSVAQIGQMIYYTIITPAEGVARFVSMGYDQADANLMGQLYQAVA